MSEIANSFRRANETLRERFGRYELPPGEQLPFLCECSERTCTNLVWLALDEYQAVRDDPEAFLIVPGHNDTETEQLVDDQSALHDVPGSGERFAAMHRKHAPESGDNANQARA